MTARGASRRVALLPTCLIETVRPAAAAAVVRVLERAGHDTFVPHGSTCCGQPAWNSGFAKEARRVARRTLRALSRSQGPIVVPSGSCTVMIREHWPAMFAGTSDADAATDVAGRVEEFSIFLARSAGGIPTGEQELAPRTTGPSAGARTVAYHDSCHMLRGLGGRDEPRDALAAAGVPVVPIAGSERCCGFGGTFSVKLPELSVAMADEKLDEVVAAGVQRLVSCDLSCLLHLGGRAKRRGLDIDICHLAEVLDGD